MTVVALLHGRVSAEAKTPTHRATLYAFFATWCVPCRIELPHIERLHRTYASQGLKVVIVSEDAPSTAQNIPAFLARFGVTAPWVLDNESELLERFNPTANVPYTVLTDPNGKVLFAHSGYEPGDERLLEAAIKKHVAIRDTAAATPNGATDRSPPSASGVRVTTNTQGVGVWRTSRFDPNEDEDGLLRAAAARVEVSGYAGAPAGKSGAKSAHVRVDGASVFDDIAPNDHDARLERVRLQTQAGPIRLLAGDDYVSFGHGVSLSLRKVDPLGLDTSLRGGRIDAEFRGGKATVVAGFTNPQNLDPIQLRVIEEMNDFIAGTEVEVNVGKRGVIAPYVVVVNAEGAAGDGADITWLSNGVSTQLTLGPIVLAAEAAAGIRDGKAVEAETPWAGYASIQWTHGPVTALVDTKAYRHWLIGRNTEGLLYHEPPTLEREDQEVPSNDNAIGARARLEWRATHTTTVFGNALAYRFTQDETSPTNGSQALHGYLGAEKRWGDTSMSVQGGYRDENRSDGGDKLSLWHVDVDAAILLATRLALTLKWNHRQETKNVFEDIKFRRGLGVLGLSWSGIGAASLLYGYSTERKDGTAPQHYPAGELLIHLPRGGSARLFVGRLTGGRVCVSGSCRDVPPFQGARLDLSIQL